MLISSVITRWQHSTLLKVLTELPSLSSMAQIWGNAYALSYNEFLMIAVKKALVKFWENTRNKFGGGRQNWAEADAPAGDRGRCPPPWLRT